MNKDQYPVYPAQNGEEDRPINPYSPVYELTLGPQLSCVVWGGHCPETAQFATGNF
jgi:hypothetical protein